MGDDLGIMRIEKRWDFAQLFCGAWNFGGGEKESFGETFMDKGERWGLLVLGDGKEEVGAKLPFFPLCLFLKVTFEKNPYSHTHFCMFHVPLTPTRR